MTKKEQIKCRLFSYNGHGETELFAIINDLGNIEINAEIDSEHVSIELSASSAMELSRQLHECTESLITSAMRDSNA